MAAAVVSFVVEKLGNLLIEEVVSLYGVHGEVGSIERELTRIQCFIKDAEAKQKGDERVRNWVRDIKDLAYDVEDIIDTFILKLTCQRRRSGFSGFIKRCRFFFRQLEARHKLAEDIQLIKSRIHEISSSRTSYGIENIGEGTGNYICERLHERRRSSPHIGDHDVIGFDEDIRMLVARLLDQDTPRLSIISIVGMGGLGKTTLAKKVYNSNSVKRHFELCAWVYVSQDYRARELLHEIGNKVLGIEKGRLAMMNKEDLEEKLSKILGRKRYLIVLDDIWKTQVWGDLKAIFQDPKNGSRVLFTTRIRDVAIDADPRSPLHELHFLKDAKSWELFMRKAFPIEGDSITCPAELEKLGKQIVGKCGGLPLAIVILGGLLSRKEKTPSVWLRVLQSITWQLTHDPNQVLEILALSYNDLPYYLKPCFLYFGLFPEDFEIPVRKLVLLWIAEGFVQQRGEESMEDVAEDFLDELVDRSLIQVAEKRYDGRIKTCRIHDLLRDLAMSEARENKFHEIIENANRSPLVTKMRRIGIHTSFDSNAWVSQPNLQLRSLLRFSKNQESLRRDQLNSLCQSLKLLRVLDLEGVIVSVFPEELGELIHLRYLSLRNTGLRRLPFSIINLRNLQTLDIRETKISRVPRGIWQLQGLRHLHLLSTAIAGRPPAKFSATNLRTISVISIYGNVWIADLLGKLTNLRKLGIHGYFASQAEALSSSIYKLSSLEELELRGSDPILEPTLKLLVDHPSIHKLYLSGAIKKLPSAHELQPNLSKLSLEMSQLVEDPLAVLERLPNLKILELLTDSFCGKQMVCSMNGFPKLHGLELQNLDNLEEWRVEDGAMPSLRHLVIHGCEELKKLPQGLEHVTSLKELVLENINDEFRDRMQQNYGDDWHKVHHVPSVVIRG